MRFMDEWKKENLCTYFILPLLRLNKFSFTSSNFIESFLTRDGKCIVVQVYNTHLIREGVLSHPGFHGIKEKDNTFLVIFTIPHARRNDVQLFIKGKYSRMSEGSKDLIRALSTLDYRSPGSTNSSVKTDGRLLALERHAALRRAYEVEFDLNEALSPDDELLNEPTDRSFINLEDV